MIPFRNSLPYDIIMKEVYVSECPFCGASNVKLPLKPSELSDLKGGTRKHRVVFPCCHTLLYLVDSDNDYLLADRALRQ